MKSKRLLSLMLLCFAMFGVARAQETLTVHDGTATNGNVPVYGYYADAYLKCEMVYPAAELEDMDGGTITSMTFYASSPASDSWGNANFQVFLTEVANATISAYVGPGTIVYEGALDGTQSEMTITFTTPYVYNGGNLLVGVYNTVAGDYVSITWAGEQVTGASITGYSYSSLDGVSATQRNFLPKTTFGYTPGEVVGCGKPKQLAVNYTGGTSATVTWTGDATLYNIDVNGTVTNNVTSPYTLSGLELGTTYAVKVQANCDGDLSDFTNAVSFTTDLCMPENQCNLTFVLTDTYGDSWNGNAIQVKDVATGVIVGTLANENLNGTSGSGENETQTVTLAVCDGRELEFSWVAGNYPGETQYTVTDINNEVIVEGSGAFDTFTFTPNCTPVTCERPLDLAVTYNGGTTAQVSWQGHAESYNIDLNGTVIEGITNTEYELTGLELATAYSVMVQANCGADGLSNWTNAVSFMTDLCMPEDMCQISLALVDSYGDGWNGAAIEVYDFDTITEDLTLLNTFTLESGTSSGNFTLNVCDGRYLVFFWSAGNYDSECSYAVYDNLGDPIFSGSDAMDDYELFFMNCNSTCRTPIEFAASEIGGHSVMLNWTEQGEATSWTLAYMSENDTVVSYVENITTKPYMLEGLTPLTKYYAMVTANCEDQQKWSDVISWTTDAACPKPHITVNAVPTSALVSWTGFADEYEFEWALMPETTSKDALWLQYDNGTMATGIGNGTTQYEWTWGVMYPASMLAGNGMLSKVSIYETAQYNTQDITINVYTGGDEAPETLVYTETVTPAGVDGFHEITFAEPVTINPTQNLWITLTETGYYVIAACQGTESNNDWVDNGGWAHIGDLASSLAGYNWMIRGYVEPAYDPDELDWQSVPGATSPVTLADLDPETQYIVRIKALCGGEDGESEWATYVFWTPSVCDTPTNLEAEVEATSATLSWSDYQESYNLNYRYALPADPTAPATIILEANDVWEDGSGYMMLLDADTTAYGTLWNANHYIFVDGEQYSGGDLPASYFDEFEYKIPTGANGALDDSINVVVTGSVTIQIPAGTYDYVIFNPTPGDRFYIAADNGEVPCARDNFVFEPGVTYHFTMQRFGSGDGAAFEIIRPMSDWILVENVNTPYELTGLTPKTAYEWQVQGVNCDGEGHNTDWTEVATFTTPEQTNMTQTIALAAGQNWVSFNVETDLATLQTALTDVLGTTGVTIQIKSQLQYAKINRGRWTGNLTELNVAQMYVITVSSDCEIQLEGMPVDPAEHSVTFTGTSWIAYPLLVNMTLTDAFNGFAVTGDGINGQTQSAKVVRNRWTGNLNNIGLEPGKGYKYTSGVAGERTLVFPTSAKTAPKSMQPEKARILDCKQKKVNTSDLQIPTQTPRMSAMDRLLKIKNKK